MRRHSAEVSPIGHNEQQTIRIPCIMFKFRMPLGQSYQLTWKQFQLHLAYTMMYNKCQSQTLSRVLCNITSPPFSHGQLYVALSHVQGYRNIGFYVTDEELMQSKKSSPGFMPIVNNIVYQNVLSLHETNHDIEGINPGNQGLSSADKQGRYLLLRILHKIT